jgi:hypothetical protein
MNGVCYGASGLAIARDMLVGMSAVLAEASRPAEQKLDWQQGRLIFREFMNFKSLHSFQYSHGFPFQCVHAEAVILFFRFANS